MTRKISRAVAANKRAEQKELLLGNPDAERDWGYAPDYVISMWRMLQQDQPKDLVVGTGNVMTVKQFAEHCFESANLNGEYHVRFDERYLRPTEIDSLIAVPSLGKETILLEHSVGAEAIADEMVIHDLENSY